MATPEPDAATAALTTTSGENHSPSNDDRHHDLGRKKAPRIFPTWYSLVIFAFVCSVFALIMVADRQLPSPSAASDAKRNPGRFLEGRARSFLKQLTSLGPRTAGRRLLLPVSLVYDLLC